MSYTFVLTIVRLGSRQVTANSFKLARSLHICQAEDGPDLPSFAHT